MCVEAGFSQIQSHMNYISSLQVDYAELQDLPTDIRNCDANKDSTTVYTQVIWTYMHTFLNDLTDQYRMKYSSVTYT